MNQKPKAPLERKTPGSICDKRALILTAAEMFSQITWKTFEDAMTKEVAIATLNNLRREGRLKVIRSGGRGRYSDPTIYGPNSK